MDPIDFRGRRAEIALITDSIGNFQRDTAKAWHYALVAFSGGLLRHRGQFGTDGFDLAQIEATHLPQVLALSPLPGSVVVAGGTNDVGAGNGPYVEAESRATLLRIFDSLEAVGIRPIGWTLPPRDDAAEVNQRVHKWNAWVRSICQARGYALVDSHSALVDAGTGLFKTELKLDDVHPNREGHQTIAEATAASPEFMKHFVGTPVQLLTSVTDASHLASNPRQLLFLDGHNGAGRPWGWVEYWDAEHIGNIITDDPSVVGAWFEISKPAGDDAAYGGYQYDITTGFSAGDVIECAFRYDMIADPLCTGFVFAPSIQALDASNGVIGIGRMMEVGGTRSGIVSARVQATATTTKIRVNLAVEGAPPTIDSRVRVAQVMVVNRTAQGLVA